MIRGQFFANVRQVRKGKLSEYISGELCRLQHLIAKTSLLF